MHVPVDEDISQLSLQIWQSAAELVADAEPAATTEPDGPEGRGGEPHYVASGGAAQAAVAAQEPPASHR